MDKTDLRIKQRGFNNGYVLEEGAGGRDSTAPLSDISTQKSLLEAMFSSNPRKGSV